MKIKSIMFYSRKKIYLAENPIEETLKHTLNNYIRSLTKKLSDLYNKILLFM